VWHSLWPSLGLVSGSSALATARLETPSQPFPDTVSYCHLIGSLDTEDLVAPSQVTTGDKRQGLTAGSLMED
jgi:hypothetical protein